jgi:hypothetical protein
MIIHDRKHLIWSRISKVPIYTIGVPVRPVLVPEDLRIIIFSGDKESWHFVLAQTKRSERYEGKEYLKEVMNSVPELSIYSSLIEADELKMVITY